MRIFPSIGALAATAFAFACQDTSQLTQPEAVPTPESGSGPSFKKVLSPQDRIVFLKADAVGYDIYVMNADGSGQTNLTSSAADEDNPESSPDGTQIAFHRSGGISVINADGTGLESFLVGGTDLQWSPDGLQILFHSGGEIYTANADGTSVENRTNTPLPNESQGAWSPDGLQIAFADASDDVSVMDADGNNKQALTSDPARDGKLARS